MADAATSADPNADVPAYLFSRDLSATPPQPGAPARFDPTAIIKGAQERDKEMAAKGEGLLAQQKEIGDREKADIDRLASLRERAFKPIGAPADPKLEKMPTPPSEKFQDPMKAFSSPGVFLASLGSLFTRHPMTTAFQAGAAALEGFQKGDAAAAEAQRERWQEAVKVAAENNRNELERYNAAWKKTEHNMTERAAMLNEIAVSQKDTIMKAAIDQGNLDQAYKLLQDRGRAQEHLDEVLIREQDRREGLDLRKRALATMLGPGDPDQAKAIAEGRQAPPTGRQAMTPQGKDLMRQVYDINPNYDAGKDWFAKKSAETTTASAEPRALSATLKTLEGQKAAITQFEETARKNGRVLVQLAENVDTTGVPVIERWLRDGDAALGDPNVKVFYAQLTAYRNEVAKIITNPNLSGALTVSAMEEAEKFVNGNDSAATIRAVVKLFEGDFDRRRQSLDSEMNTVRGRLGLKPIGGGDSAETPGSNTAGQSPLPPEIASQLKEGQPTRLRSPDGDVQVWTLRNGQPVRTQ